MATPEEEKEKPPPTKEEENVPAATGGGGGEEEPPPSTTWMLAPRPPESRLIQECLKDLEEAARGRRSRRKSTTGDDPALVQQQGGKTTKQSVHFKLNKSGLLRKSSTVLANKTASMQLHTALAEEESEVDSEVELERMLARLEAARNRPDPRLLRRIQRNQYEITKKRLARRPDRYRDFHLARILRDTGLSGLPLAQRTIKELEEESIEVNTLVPQALCINDKNLSEIFGSVKHLVVMDSKTSAQMARRRSRFGRKTSSDNSQQGKTGLSNYFKGDQAGGMDQVSTLQIRKRVVLKNGKINTRPIRIDNESSHYLADTFTTLVDAKWRYTLLAFVLSFFLSWTLFAGLYYLMMFIHRDFEDDHLPDVQADNNWTPCILGIYRFSSTFLFSVETQQTIGYGTRAPTDACTIVGLTVCIQSIVGMMIQAFMVGIIFTKLSRPTKRAKTLTFSKRAVICKHDGYLTLMCRVGDMRTSQIIGAEARAQVIRRRVTMENDVLPFEQKELTIGPEHGESRLFLIWPQILMHRIDEDSPFYFMDYRDFSKARFEIVVIMEGVVQSTSSTVQARNSYLPREVLWGHRFPGLISFNKGSGSYTVDYERFHDTETVNTPRSSQHQLDRMMKRRLAGGGSNGELRDVTNVPLGRGWARTRPVFHAEDDGYYEMNGSKFSDPFAC